MNVESSKKVMKRMGYGFTGSYSAVKPCSWLKKSLLGEGVCYKEQFYGIKCHRCLQMSPCVQFCNHFCKFCWRPFEASHLGTKMPNKVDEPDDIIERAFKEYERLLSGFGGNSKVNKKKLKEAMNPKHAAISLAGEPTLYPKISELIKAFHKKGMTTFLVTNGTNPDVLRKLKEMPTQLYLTLPAPNEEVYKKTCNPAIHDGWKRIIRSINVLSKMKTRKVVRLTLVKGLNMVNPEGYAKILKNKKIHFIEPKAFMSVGYARKRIHYNKMPLFEEIKNFSQELADAINYKIIDEKADSRVCLIAKKDYSWRKLKF